MTLGKFKFTARPSNIGKIIIEVSLVYNDAFNAIYEADGKKCLRSSMPSYLVDEYEAILKRNIDSILKELPNYE